MIAHEHHVDGLALDDERSAALARLEADLIALGASLAVTRAVAGAYRIALLRGAGDPGHQAWYRLADSVAEFLAGVRAAATHGAAAAARRRLRMLVAERAG